MIATDEQITTFLTTPGKIAIVGASTNTSKAGYYVPKFLQDRGFEPIPINPKAEKIFDTATVDSLEELTEHYSIHDFVGVIIYRRQPYATQEAKNAIDLGLPFIWLPLGVSSDEAEAYAAEQKVQYVHNRCPIPESRRLGI